MQEKFIGTKRGNLNKAVAAFMPNSQCIFSVILCFSVILSWVHFFISLKLFVVSFAVCITFHRQKKTVTALDRFHTHRPTHAVHLQLKDSIYVSG